MRYNIFDGGNLLQHPWEVATSGKVGNARVNYAEHHKRRTLEIEKHIDTQSRIWMGQYDGLNAESDKPIVLVNGDELGTHLFGKGSMIDYVVFHVKRPGAGTIKPFIEYDNTRALLRDPSGQFLEIDLSKTGHYIGMIWYEPPSAAGVDPAATSRIPIQIPSVTASNVVMNVNGGGTATGSVTMPSYTVYADVPSASILPPSYMKPLPLMTESNGVIGFTFTAALDGDGKPMPFDTCVGIYMAVKDFWNEHECECAPQPCETEYPDPLCTVNPRIPEAG